MAERHDIEKAEPKAAKQVWQTPECRQLPARESRLAFHGVGVDNVTYS